MFGKYNSAGNSVLAIYVDDILLTKTDKARIAHVKAYLQEHLIIRDLRAPKYFLAIKFAHQPVSLCE